MTVGGPVKCFGSFGSNFGFVAVGEGRSAHEVLLGLVSVNFTSIKVWIHREKFGLCQILNLVWDWIYIFICNLIRFFCNLWPLVRADYEKRVNNGIAILKPVYELVTLIAWQIRRSCRSRLCQRFVWVWKWSSSARRLLQDIFRCHRLLRSYLDLGARRNCQQVYARSFKLLPLLIAWWRSHSKSSFCHIFYIKILLY